MASRRPPRRTVTDGSPVPLPFSVPPAEAGVPAFSAADSTGSVVAARRRRKTPVWQTATLWLGGLLAFGAVAFGIWSASRPVEVVRSLTLRLPPDPTVQEMTPLQFRVGVAGQGVAQQDVRYQLINPPAGATLDASTGDLSWTPTEQQGPGRFPLMIRIEAAGPTPLADEGQVVVTVTETPRPPVFDPIPEQTIDGVSAVSLVVRAADPDLPASSVTYSLDDDNPAGAAIDPVSGRFTWTPAGSLASMTTFTIRATESGPDGQSALQSIVFRNPQPQRPADLLAAVAADLEKAGLTATASERERLPIFPTIPRSLSVTDPDGEGGGGPAEEVIFVRFSDAASLAAAVENLPNDPDKIFGREQATERPLNLYRTDDSLVLYAGDHRLILDALAVNAGVAFASLVPKPMVAEAPPTPQDVQTLLKLAQKKTLFNTKQYPEIRKIFADRFERDHADQIGFAFGSDAAAMREWLDAHTDIKEELYTAIDPQHDDVVAALRLFAQLKTEFPKQIEAYAELAIATAVTWDRERGDIYEYGHHARRTHSNYGGELLDGVGNFKFLVEAEPQMQGRAQYLPWEFLVHLVNHRTPKTERFWAMQNYGNNRAMFGKIYSNVPYDDEMLRTSSAVCKLAGQDYVLPDILRLGGVCAMQADFAARVGKSMGVPAEYVGGESIYGDRHAWVMWVELKSVSKAGISFTLESHGRYRGDKFYVGDLDDPHTGVQITDRDLELRLQTVGINPVAARQARLIMKAYPLLRDAQGEDDKPMGTADQIVFLQNVIDLSPGNEQAWYALAALARDGDFVGKDRRLMQKSFDNLFRTFGNFPDFTWLVFDDLVRFFDNPRQRNQLYEKLVALYESAGRPDLACEARLRLSDHLVAEGSTTDAINGLAYTIKKFPDEGRYVPRLLDKLETVAAGIPGTDAKLVQFYTEFLPAIPRTRGGDPSKYCMEMYERAIALFQQHNQPQLAQALSIELAKVRAGGTR